MVATVGLPGIGRAGVSTRPAGVADRKSLGAAALVRFQCCQCRGVDRFCAGALLGAPTTLGAGGIAAQLVVWLVLSTLEYRRCDNTAYLVQRWVFYAVSIKRLKIRPL